jgi:methionine-rich copper-binding protein CopC
MRQRMMPGPSARAAIVAASMLFASCAQSTTAAPAASSERSILVESKPADGSTVQAPVDDLDLHFSPAAVLNEVTVTGPDGTMPVMITPIGEVEHYSIPLPGLVSGSYTVTWRAASVGRPHKGSFTFSVR